MDRVDFQISNFKIDQVNCRWVFNHLASMTKRELVVRISEESGLKHQAVMQIVQKTLDQIRGAISNGEKVELRNFGVFDLRVRKAKKGRNPKLQGTELAIPPKVVVKFKPGKEMREGLQKLSPKTLRG